MNHTEAVSRGAAERYLLGQLSASESDEFEQHFFDCEDCARELRAGAMFEENARAVFLDERPPQLKAESSFWVRFWERPWIAAPAFAAVALAAVTAYHLAVVIPGLRSQLHQALSPQAMASFVLPPVSRGDARSIEVPAGARFYSIYMDPTWEGSFTEYLCSVQDESGSTRFRVRLPAPPPGKPIQILMARPLLAPGRYTVVIHNAAENGKREAELARYALILKFD